jgi:hypothetical protein
MIVLKLGMQFYIHQKLLQQKKYHKLQIEDTRNTEDKELMYSLVSYFFTNCEFLCELQTRKQIYCPAILLIGNFMLLYTNKNLQIIFKSTLTVVNVRGSL